MSVFIYNRKFITYKIFCKNYDYYYTVMSENLKMH